ncbi:hypothetical protein [Tautonia sociabilis]|uniref:Uncharacterized protein n=1 Tax=Tautonia sociabilis TaxID=2080755 RepID=A0A432MPM1_9BACT|nr:hypothetical protein [Tautonia sociabilis]RUL89209.1 hypothetical protein TsocGM_03585 [Tautonia sociabilis]
MADGAMLVLAASAASALFAKLVALIDGSTMSSWKRYTYDIPALTVLGVMLTAIALGAYKRHSTAQVLFQATLACLALLAALAMAELGWNRAPRS